MNHERNKGATHRKQSTVGSDFRGIKHVVVAETCSEKDFFAEEKVYTTAELQSEKESAQCSVVRDRFRWVIKTQANGCEWYQLIKINKVCSQTSTEIHQGEVSVGVGAVSEFGFEGKHVTHTVGVVNLSSERVFVVVGEVTHEENLSHTDGKIVTTRSEWRNIRFVLPGLRSSLVATVVSRRASHSDGIGF